MTRPPTAPTGLPGPPDPHASDPRLAAAPAPGTHTPGAQAAGPHVAGRPPQAGPRAPGQARPGAPAAPEPGGRNGTARPGVLRRIGTVIVTLALIALAAYLDTKILDQDALDAPITSHAGLGEVAETGRFSARLEQVEFARSIELQNTRVNGSTGEQEVTRSTRLDTKHIFVIATVSATTPKEPTKVSVAGLSTPEDIFYVATDRVDIRFTLGNTYIQPGFWVKGVFVFEVPPEAIAGSRVVLSIPSGNGIYDSIYPNRYDQLLPEVALDLGLDEAKAKSAVAAAKDVYQLKAAE